MNRKNLANKVKASMLAIATFAMLFVSCEDDEKLGVELPSLTVTPSTLTLKVGEKEMAEANITPVIWSSSAATIAAVDPATGEITALALGTATVTATRSDGETATCSVIVLPVRPITGVRITPVPVPEVVAGDILRLSAVPVPEDATDFNPVWVWSSSDGTVAAVSETGLLTGVSAGMATITVTLADDPAITTQTAVTIASPFNFIPVGTMTSNELKAFASNAGYSDYVNLMKTGISIHKVEYSTSLNNSKVKVSGLLVIPETVSAQRAIAVYNHGTMKKDVAPSFCNTTNPYPDITVCYCFTSALNVVFLIPDYIGHGKSVSTVHLYVHAESLGQTSLDMIRTYINSEMPGAAPENRKVVIMGYSEGGYASVALHKKIQETAPDIQIVKTYAGAGPYDLKYFMKEVLQKNEELPENTISSYLWVLDTYKNLTIS